MWLLETETRNEMRHAEKHGMTPTAAERDEFVAYVGSSSGSQGSRILKYSGSTAEISISGILTKSHSIIAWMLGYGNTSYPEIASALTSANSNPDIKNITLNVDSPGGHFDGLFDALAAIQAVSKPITTVVSNLAASAAYAIVGQADKIVAKNRAARVGSIGVVATFYVDDHEVEITSTGAPQKRPDVKTKAGISMVREELDAMHDLFVDSIAKGRGKTVETINAEFGQGATLLADEALKRGMIDAIATGDSGQASKSATYTDSIGAQSVLDLVEAKLGITGSPHDDQFLGKPEHRPAASARQETSVMDLVETALGITNNEVIAPEPTPQIFDAAPAPRQTEPAPSPKTQMDVAKNLLKTAFGIDQSVEPNDRESSGEVLAIVEKALGIVALA
jgi:ClpP class serine protease